MSTGDHDDRSSRGLYRDRENGWIFGVCAGIADYGNMRVTTIRIIAVICLLVFFWATILTYVAATLLFKEKRLTYAGRSHEDEFWRRHTTDGGWGRS